MTTPAPIAVLLRSPAFGWAARTLLTLPYAWSGLGKLADLTGARAEAASLGLEPPGLFVAATIAVQLIGSALLISGRWAWLAAGALGVFTGLATLIAHPYWTIADPAARFHAINTFLEHIGLIGGLMPAAGLAGKGRAA
ncbi:DoxX family protein [Caulobacter vibrioides]|uniref:DoxX family protein n=1 Tax=Caulobacter vibrioides TaxID=155892 RepID=A0A290MJ19_CAUVI|nr:DoxX family protein [Caulobacter vibrioides]ATC32008.1 DoxX family protein [Caulobacter vibrioides]